MVGESKILTVSYGTFSCTLEGFDDPFSMMKAIAEYFRDLAEQDRFFGAEPPQPDADILHKIAEQTIKARVSAEVSDNSLILRQDHGSAKTEQSAPANNGDDVVDAVATAASLAANSEFESGDTIAEKLQRIRAVVSRDIAAPTAESNFFSEDEHAEQFEAEDTTLADAIATFDDDTPAELTEADSQTEDYEEEAADDDATSETLANIMSAVEEPEIEDAPALEEVRAETEEVDTAEDNSDDADEVEADSEEMHADAEMTGAAESLSDHAEIDADADVAEDDTDADADEFAPRRPVIVQKISRADVEAALPATDDALSTDDATPELSAEAEEALMRELASVEADMEASEAAELNESNADGSDDVLAEQANTSPEEVDAEHVADAQPKEGSRHGRAALLVEDEDAALNRLMDATSSRMSDDDEGAVRRASIAHLKAAVAATKADESIAKAVADEDARELDQYRDDLARVVRPGRAQPRGDNGNTSRPSPLVLVGEQRIDPSEAANGALAASNVHPRRITSGNLALEQDFDDETHSPAMAAGQEEEFGAYAKRHDALELPALLEAAAAHFTFVEGNQEFTRPMLMRKISSVEDMDAPTREEGLRSFGALLRENRIVKDGTGKFILAENSRFAPEAQGGEG